MTARPDAPELSAAVDKTGASDADFRWMLTNIEATPDAPEALRERVAVALWRSDTEDEFPGADLERLWPKVVSNFPTDAAAYRKLADAALAVVRGETS